MIDKHTDIVDESLGRIRGRRWPGPEHHPALEQRIKEASMRHKLSNKTTIGIIAGVLICGGAVTAGIIHYATTHATVTDADGNVYELDLDPNGTGEITTEAGDLVQIQTSENAGEMQATITVAPGQTGVITVGDETGETVVTVTGTEDSGDRTIDVTIDDEDDDD
jgi:hypothetical protein